MEAEYDLFKDHLNFAAKICDFRSLFCLARISKYLDENLRCAVLYLHSRTEKKRVKRTRITIFFS